MQPRPRTFYLAVVGLVLLAGGIILRRSWPRAEAALDCPPSQIRWSPEGLATCDGQGSAVPPAPGLTLGIKLDLNRASESDLALLPGIGPSLAKTLVSGRPFHSWDDVDQLVGIGPSKLEVLQKSTRIAAE